MSSAAANTVQIRLGVAGTPVSFVCAAMLGLPLTRAIIGQGVQTPRLCRTLSKSGWVKGRVQMEANPILFRDWQVNGEQRVRRYRRLTRECFVIGKRLPQCAIANDAHNRFQRAHRTARPHPFRAVGRPTVSVPPRGIGRFSPNTRRSLVRNKTARSAERRTAGFPAFPQPLEIARRDSHIPTASPTVLIYIEKSKY